MKLSIIIPVYNEEKTLEKIVTKIQNVDLGKIQKELIIVNDHSTDSSEKIISRLREKHPNIICVAHKANQGKGASMRTGLKFFSGDIVIFHDADLEYNPEDLKKLIHPIITGKFKIVFGSRLLGHLRGFTIPSHYYGNKFLSFLTYLLYGQKITDMETGYKMMTQEVAKTLNLTANRFDIEPEITSKVIKNGYKILEVPIDYNCRSFKEGKKITWKDGIFALYTLLKYKFKQ